MPELSPIGGLSGARCPSCGALGYGNDRYCACCGSRMIRQCRRCGSRIEQPVANFCTQCGASLMEIEGGEKRADA